MYLCQFIPLWFRASTAYFLRPFSSFFGAHLLVHFKSRDMLPSPPLAWLNMPRSPQMGSSVRRLSLESGSAPVPLPVYVPGTEVMMRTMDVPMSKQQMSQPSPVPASEQSSASPSQARPPAFARSQPGMRDPCAAWRCSNISERAFQSIMWENQL